MERLTKGKRGILQLPSGVVDPIFLHELALELKMPVGEMCERMSAAELSRDWPLYFAYRSREAQRQEQNQSQRTLG
jgi:hypothetical protein